jgi:hypothetical protein
MNNRLAATCLAFVALTQIANCEDHPLDWVPDQATGSLIFPNLTSFKTKADKFVAAVYGGGFDLSSAAQFVGSSLKVTGAADDDKPICLYWFDPKLVDPKNNSSESFITAIPISDVKRLAENLDVDIEKLKSGKSIATEKNGKRFHRLVDGYVYISMYEGLFKFTQKRGNLTKQLPASRVKALKDSDVLAVFSSRTQNDQIDWFQDRTVTWLKQNRDADEEEKKIVSQLFEALSKATHLSISMRVDEGLVFNTDLFFDEKDDKEIRKLMAALNPNENSATLAGLPKGDVLLANAGAANGARSLPALSILSRELYRGWLHPSIRKLDKAGFLNQSQRMQFAGIFGEVYQQFDGFRFAMYRNPDPANHGMVSIVGIADVGKPAEFITDMQQLASFVNGTGLNPVGDDKFEGPTPKTIAKLIEELGDRSFRKRHSATTRLIIIGEPALTQVGKAMRSTSREVARRAQIIEKRIQAAIKESRSTQIKANLITKAQPKFIFFPNQETRQGKSVHLVELKTKETAELRVQLRMIFGPKWQHIRLVPLQDKVVFLLGSNVELLDQTLKNIATKQPGLATDPGNAVFDRPLQKKRGIEFHISPSRFAALQDSKPIIKPVADEKTFNQISLAATLRPRFLNIEWRTPQDELKATIRYFR